MQMSELVMMMWSETEVEEMWTDQCCWDSQWLDAPHYLPEKEKEKEKEETVSDSSLPPPPRPRPRPYKRLDYGYTREEMEALFKENKDYQERVVEEDGEDEDYANLSHDAKSELDSICLMNEREVNGYHIFREFWADHPSKHPDYFRNVESGSYHGGFLEQLTGARHSRTIKHAYPPHSKPKLTPRVVKSILGRHAICFSYAWIQFYEICHAVPDDGLSVYTNTIKAAAVLLYLIHTEDSLYMLARQDKWVEQTKKLWEQIQVLLSKGLPLHEFCDRLFEITADTDSYSFVTERDIARILSSYSPTGSLFCPFFYEGESNFRLPVKVEKDEEKYRILDDIIRDIAEVSMKVGSTSSEFQADAYTHRLMKLIRGPKHVEVKNLVDEVIDIVDADALVKLRDQQETVFECVHIHLARLLQHEKEKVRRQLLHVVEPLSVLNISGPPYLSYEILEIVEVAELRRMALGSRFIGRSHLMWAFFECGYGLPKIRKTIDLNSCDKDHPPYHIYVTAMKLAVFYGVKKMRVEHFIFGVLFAQDKVFDGQEDPPTEMRQDFENFMKDIALERTKMDSKSSKNFSYDLSDRGEYHFQH